MAQWLRQSTSVVIPFGPVLDKTDGVTLEIAAGIIASLDHATTGIFLSKNGGAGTIRHQAVTATTYDSHGMFLVTLDATDTATLGRLRSFHSDPATYLEVWQDFMVVPANIWDAMFGTGNLPADLQTIKTQAITCGAGVTVNPQVGAAYQISVDSDGVARADLRKILGAALTGTAALIVEAWSKFWNVATPTGTTNSLPDAVPGQDNGLAIKGSVMGAPTNMALETGGNVAAILSDVTMARQVLSNKIEVDRDTGIMIIYKDNGTDVLMTQTVTVTGRSIPAWS
jgi:hypothetical protein